MPVLFFHPDFRVKHLPQIPKAWNSTNVSVKRKILQQRRRGSFPWLGAVQTGSRFKWILGKWFNPERQNQWSCARERQPPGSARRGHLRWEIRTSRWAASVDYCDQTGFCFCFVFKLSPRTLSLNLVEGHWAGAVCVPLLGKRPLVETQVHTGAICTLRRFLP